MTANVLSVMNIIDNMLNDDEKREVIKQITSSLNVIVPTKKSKKEVEEEKINEYVMYLSRKIMKSGKKSTPR